MENLEDLELFILQFRFAYAVERRAEGGHAVINRKAALARRRTETIDSLSLRMPELRLLIQGNPSAVQEIGERLSVARSPKLLIDVLG